MAWLLALRRGLKPQLWLIVAFAAVIALYVDHARKASLSIDGERWFWLDDDQMISMRYARNLAEGHGLVWNPGERVEGYTNFGWILVMALMHLSRLPDRLMPVTMMGVSCLVCLAIFYLAARLLQHLEPKRLGLTLPALLLCMVTCTDVMLWATLGFETVLVTLLHLAVVVGAVQGCAQEAQGAKRGPLASARLLVPLALIPIVRSDGLHVWLGDAVLLLWLSPQRKRMALGLLVALVPFAAHIVFRLSYYGDLLPNTYYLKVAGLDDPRLRGFSYVRNFGHRYWLVLVLAFGTLASFWRRDPRACALLTSFVPPLLYAVQVGGDMFSPFRFFAHVMPELFLWAALGAARLLATPPARLAWLAALVGFALPPLSDPLAHIAPVGSNGDPFQQIVVASELRKNAAPNASVAVFAAGIVPYFTRLKAVDLLGKADAYIAHLPSKKGAQIGHGKIDPEYSLGKRPDYVVTNRPRSVVGAVGPLPPEGSSDYLWTLFASRPFRADWEPYPLQDPFMLEQTAVFIRRDSTELAKIASWVGVTLQR